MTKHDWVVGERCWIWTDEKPRAGKVGSFDPKSGMFFVDVATPKLGGDEWAWRGPGAIFASRKAALVNDADGWVEHCQWAADCQDTVVRQEQRVAKEAHRDLAKAKKRLAALRAKVKS